MTEDDKLYLLCEIFGWPSDDDDYLFSALLILRRVRGEETPTPDTFRARVRI